MKVTRKIIKENIVAGDVLYVFCGPIREVCIHVGDVEDSLLLLQEIARCGFWNQ